MTKKQKDVAAKRTQVLLESAFKLLGKTKSEIETDVRVYKRKLNNRK